MPSTTGGSPPELPPVGAVWVGGVRVLGGSVVGGTVAVAVAVGSTVGAAEAVGSTLSRSASFVRSATTWGLGVGLGWSGGGVGGADVSGATTAAAPGTTYGTTSPSPTDVATLGTASATPMMAMKPMESSAMSIPARRISRLRPPPSSTNTGPSPAWPASGVGAGASMAPGTSTVTPSGGLAPFGPSGRCTVTSSGMCTVTSSWSGRRPAGPGLYCIVRFPIRWGTRRPARWSGWCYSTRRYCC